MTAMPLSLPDDRLDYAPAPPLHRRKRTVRIASIAAAIILAGSAVAWGPSLYRRAVMMNVVRLSERYALPAGTVVVDDDPAAIVPAVKQPRGPVLSPLPVTALALPDPPLLNRLANVCDGGPGYFTLFARRGKGPEPLLFLHELRTPGGKPRIVAVRLTGLTYYPAGGGILALSYNWVIVEPRGWRPPKPQQTGRAWGGVHIPTSEESARGDHGVLERHPSGPVEPGRVRVFAGRADPGDRSAIDVPYEVNGIPRIFRFQLQDKGNDVDLRLQEQVLVSAPGAPRL